MKMPFLIKSPIGILSVPLASFCMDALDRSIYNDEKKSNQMNLFPLERPSYFRTLSEVYREAKRIFHQ
jgi:hypothetical protein